MSEKEKSTVSRIFLDANVIIDLVLRRDRYDSAKKLYHSIENGSVQGFISPSIVHIVAYWAKKSPYASIIKEILIELCNKVEVVDVGHKITMLALRSEMKDVEDALQYYAAVEYKMDLFISNDRRLRKEASSLPVLDPDEFIKTLSSL